MNLVSSFKVFILLLSTIMFIYQLVGSINNYINPNIADTTSILSREEIPLPLITICPLDQLNETKIEQRGYNATINAIESLFYGLKWTNKSIYITWGSDMNKTFDQLLEEVSDEDYDYSHKDGFAVSLIKNGKYYNNKYTAQLKRKLYVGFWGYCWDLEDYDITGSINIVNYFKRSFEVFITDKYLKSYYSVNVKSQLGQHLVSDATKRIWYEINMQKISDTVPGYPKTCIDYENELYAECIDKKIQVLVKPDIGCNPPWLSHQHQCDRKLILEKEFLAAYAEKLNPFVFRDDIQIEKECPTSCTQTIFNARVKAYYFVENAYGIKLSFAENIPYTSKFVTYNFSSFLIDIGSSLGLWFGLSVFGLTDLGILIFQYIKKSKFETLFKK